MGEVTDLHKRRAQVSPPEPLAPRHDVSQFDCTKAVMNEWLKKRAGSNEGRASRCYVVCEGRRVVGYYALSTGSVNHDDAPRALKHNMPNPVPVMLIGRLAVDKEFQGSGLGEELLMDAIRRMVAASKEIGARAIMLHALEETIVPFYQQYGFKEYPGGKLRMFLLIEDAVRAIA